MTTTSVAGTRSRFSPDGAALVSARHLSKRFPVRRDLMGRPTTWLSAVEDVNLEIQRGETFSVVGETGSGKSTLVQLILRLIPADAGTVLFDGADVLHAPRRQLAQLRQRMQVVFQDPFSSLDPRMNVAQIVAEGMHRLKLSRQGRRDRVHELLDMVGLARRYARRYPHELSGGERQRAAIARALAVNPEFIILDEPVSALDVSIQSQVLNLLRDLQQRLNLTYLFISHDLAVVRHISDRIGVMYLGKLVEIADKEELFHNPLHPYTQALLSAIPKPQTGEGALSQRIVLRGEALSPIDPPEQCRFAGRCFRVIDRCRQEVPPLEPVGSSSRHLAACFNMAPVGSERSESADSGQRNGRGAG